MTEIKTVVIVSCISFLLSIFVGFGFYAKRSLFSAKSKNSNFVSDANVAAAGVLIAMGFHHILCEALINLNDIFRDSIEELKLLKICTIVFFMGFMFMFIVEKLCIQHTHDEDVEKYIMPGVTFKGTDAILAKKKKG